MASETTRAYLGDIVKMDKQSDGTLMVYGSVTDDTLDIDKQVCDRGWMQREIPDWFRTGGNIREQHDPKRAAGVAVVHESKGALGEFIKAHVVDPVAVIKCETGVYKGFSVGIRRPRVVIDAKAAGGRIVDGKVIEVSLVDRPANPNCTFTVVKSVTPGMQVAPGDLDSERLLARVQEQHVAYPIDEGDFDSWVGKRDFSQDQRDNAADEGDAFPDGSYPIKTQADAENAWRLRGNSKAHSEEEVVAHIRRAVKKHGLTMPGADKSISLDLDEFAEKMGQAHADIAKDWNEDDHPRDDNGKFSGGGGSTGGGGAPGGVAGHVHKTLTDKGYTHEGATKSGSQRYGHENGDKAYVHSESSGRLNRVDSFKGGKFSDSIRTSTSGLKESGLVGHYDATGFADRLGKTVMLVSGDITKGALDSAIKDAVRAVGRLLQQEAEDVANGDMNEVPSLEALTQTLRTLNAFVATEVAEGEMAGPLDGSSPDTAGSVVDAALRTVPLPGQFLRPAASLAVQEGDITKMSDDKPTPGDGHPFKPGEGDNADKCAVCDGADDSHTSAGDGADDKSSTPDIVKALTDADPDALGALLQTHIDKAVAPLKEENESLQARLSEVEKAAVPGGPQRVRTPAEANKSAAHDLKIEIDRLQALADVTESPSLAKGYRDMVHEKSAQYADLIK